MYAYKKAKSDHNEAEKAKNMHVVCVVLKPI
jgi:hypothetical protein